MVYSTTRVISCYSFCSKSYCKFYEKLLSLDLDDKVYLRVISLFFSTFPIRSQHNVEKVVVFVNLALKLVIFQGVIVGSANFLGSWFKKQAVLQVPIFC